MRKGVFKVLGIIGLFTIFVLCLNITYSTAYVEGWDKGYYSAMFDAWSKPESAPKFMEEKHGPAVNYETPKVEPKIQIEEIFEKEKDCENGRCRYQRSTD